MAIKLQGTNSAAAPGLTNDGGDGVVVGTDSVDISIGGASKVKVDSSGRVGMGTASPSTDSIVHIYQPSTSSSAELRVENNRARNAYTHYKTTTGDWACGTGIGGDWDEFHVYDVGQSAIKLTVNTSGDIVPGGNLVLGSAKGINFDPQGANNVNLLDDYEEGDWTPTINDGGFGIASDDSSTYTKIGNVVTVNCFISLNGTGNGDSLEMGGFPFTVATDKFSAAIVDFGKGAYKGAYIRPNGATTTANFLKSSENPSNNRAAIVGNEVGVGYIIFTVSYMTS